MEKQMNKYNHIKAVVLQLLSFAILSATLPSCNKWLDIHPKSQIEEGELFASESGFEEALNGVYIRLGQPDVYGEELTTGLPDVLAQNYSLSTDLDLYKYLQTERFKYTDPDFIQRRDNIFKGLYNGIVNLNLILEHLEGQEALFTGNNYNLIKAEALGLRAYVHFDLFRLFGSSMASGGSVGIPYVTTYSNKVTALSTPREVMDKIEKDLTTAKELLKPIDPIISDAYVIDYPGSDSTTEAKDPSLFMQMRRNRFNYYAAAATLARVYLYDQKNQLAEQNALEVIEADKFPWTDAADVTSVDEETKDLLFYKELVFGWHAPWAVEGLTKRFESGTGGLFLDKDEQDRIYEFNSVGGEDIRYKNWFELDVNGKIEFQKYHRNPKGDETNPADNLFPQTLPAIRLSEMYYIAAETTFDQDPVKAAAYVDSVRFNRGIGVKFSATSKADFLSQLTREARKEFYGEGQVFYMYKRLNMSFPGHNGTQITARPDVFVLPLPVNEIEFGNR